jgi:recombination associated protein RdgC
MKIFSKATIYVLPDNFTVSTEQLERSLKPFFPCPPLQGISTGFIAPCPDGKILAHSANGCILVCLQVESRKVPSDVVKSEFKKRLLEFEQVENRRFTKDERATLKEQITSEFMPRVFSKFSKVYGYFDLKNRWFIVNSASEKVSSSLVSAIRESLGSFPVVMLQPENSASGTMTKWLKKQSLPDKFSFGVIAMLEDDAVITCKNQDLITPEIAKHIDSGKEVTSMSMCWNDIVSFELNRDFVLKKLHFTHSDDDSVETPQQRFDGDFCLLTGEMAVFLPELIAAFGGEMRL